MQVAAKQTYHSERAEIEQEIALDEYAIHAANGEPEGSIFAVDHKEAAELWAMEALRNGDGRLLSVLGRGESCSRWFEVRRNREDATARECSV